MKFFVADRVFSGGVGPSDKNNGLSPNTPLKTIEKALALADALRGDTIVLLKDGFPMPVEVYPFQATLVLEFHDA